MFHPNRRTQKEALCVRQSRHFSQEDTQKQFQRKLIKRTAADIGQCGKTWFKVLIRILLNEIQQTAAPCWLHLRLAVSGNDSRSNRRSRTIRCLWTSAWQKELNETAEGKTESSWHPSSIRAAVNKGQPHETINYDTAISIKYYQSPRGLQDFWASGLTHRVSRQWGFYLIHTGEIWNSFRSNCTSKVLFSGLLWVKFLDRHENVFSDGSIEEKILEKTCSEVDLS